MGCVPVKDLFEVQMCVLCILDTSWKRKACPGGDNYLLRDVMDGLLQLVKQRWAVTDKLHLLQSCLSVGSNPGRQGSKTKLYLIEISTQCDAKIVEVASMYI